MSFFKAMEVAASGLSAQRVRLNALSSNLANAQTTRTPEGGPYKRLDPVFRSVPLDSRFEDAVRTPTGKSISMVSVPEVREDTSPPRTFYDPEHPDADESGMVSLPNINVVQEMVNLVTASRSYESGVTVISSIKSMARAALRIQG